MLPSLGFEVNAATAVTFREVCTVDSSNLQMVKASRAQDVASVSVKSLHLLNVFVLDVAEAAGTGDVMKQNGIWSAMIWMWYTWCTASSARSCSGCSADTSWPPWSRTSWWTPQMLHCANISRGSAKLYARMLRQGAQMDVSLWGKMCISDSPPAQTLLSHVNWNWRVKIQNYGKKLTFKQSISRKIKFTK